MNPDGKRLRAQQGLATDEFLLRPLRETDAEYDYEAVMETREFLRDWEGTGWPQDDFTVGANREDLIGLERRHQNEESFTYTVVTPTADRCLGCVYILPTNAQLFAKAEVSPKGSAKWADFQAAVYFWVRTSCMAEGLDERLIGALETWFQREWGLDDYLFVTNELLHQQIALLKRTGRKVRFELGYQSKPGRELAFS